MSWWGKLFGGAFGFILGGPLGALIGAALGHNIDARMKEGFSPFAGAGMGDRERTQTAFFTATFSVLGHLSKADGRVSQHEIRLAQAVMDQLQLNQKLRGLAQDLFRQGKSPDFPLDDVLDQFKRECRHRHALMRIFVEVLLQSAYADGVMHRAERTLMLHICERLSFSRTEFERLAAMVRAAREYHRGGLEEQTGDLARAYQILNVSDNASDAEVKKAYRRLMNQHHPDKLVAKGLPEEMMKLAAEKTHEIRSAYEEIRAARGF